MLYSDGSDRGLSRTLCSEYVLVAIARGGLARGAENMVFLAGQCFCFAAVVYFEYGLLETFSR